MTSISAPRPESAQPRVVVIRAVADAKSGLALLAGNISVLFVLRVGDSERRRILDLLVGWSLGSGGSLDRIGPNTIATRPHGAPPVQAARGGVVSAVDAAFGTRREVALSREEEERLRPLAATGSADARRRLTDAHAELATLIALWLRPPHMSASTAVSIAQQELDAIIAWHPSRKPLLVDLVARLHSRLNE